MLREEVAATPIVERLRVLIDQGADPRKPIEGTRFQNTLQLAAYHGKTDIVEFLLSGECPADKRVNETEGTGYGTALQAAAAKGHLEVVQLLLKDNEGKKSLNMNGECFDGVSRWLS
ncbi:hypothetical protein B0H13DRAFT_1594846 [Mycena leptocephala]|nr:hypothetical protein B0H13DRAFT_1594846 [Mycena leptocephala]